MGFSLSSVSCGFFAFTEPRGARQRTRPFAPQACIRSIVQHPTMKQSFASTARLRGGRPILRSALKPAVLPGSPPRIRTDYLSLRCGQEPKG